MREMFVMDEAREVSAVPGISVCLSALLPGAASPCRRTSEKPLEEGSTWCTFDSSTICPGAPALPPQARTGRYHREATEQSLPGGSGGCGQPAGAVGQGGFPESS